MLIDCPPVLGNLTDNALNAARAVVIPIPAEATSVRALELLFDQIDSVERGLTITVQVLAVVPNLVQGSTIAKKILTELRAAIPTLTPFELRKRVLLQAAWGAGRSIFGYQPTSHADPRPARRPPRCTHSWPGWSWPGQCRREGQAMAEGRHDRTDKLSQRFHRHATGTPPAGHRRWRRGGGSGAAST